MNLISPLEFRWNFFFFFFFFFFGKNRSDSHRPSFLESGSFFFTRYLVDKEHTENITDQQKAFRWGNRKRQLFLHIIAEFIICETRDGSAFNTYLPEQIKRISKMRKGYFSSQVNWQRQRPEKLNADGYNSDKTRKDSVFPTYLYCIWERIRLARQTSSWDRSINFILVLAWLFEGHYLQNWDHVKPVTKNQKTHLFIQLRRWLIFSRVLHLPTYHNVCWGTQTHLDTEATHVCTCIYV